MTLKKVNCDYFRYAKEYDVLNDRIFLYTGKRIIILDMEKNFIHEIKGLDYVYRAVPSPDGKSILAASTTNKFYIISADDYHVEAITIKGKYNGNLECRGCWSLDGKSIYLPVENKQTFKSNLRKYDIGDMSFEDSLIEQYWIVYVSCIRSEKRYLVIGLDREKEAWYLIWYDECEYSFFEIENFNDVISDVKVDETNKEIFLFCDEEMYIYDFEGRKVIRREAK